MSTKNSPKTAETLAGLNLNDLNSLAKWLEKSGLEEVEIESGEGASRTRLRLKKPGMVGTAMVAAAPMAATPAAAAAPAPENDLSGAFTSPMVGTFYTAASPESAAFVKEGDTVKVGQTLCIIEAMKTMNQIAATTAGTVKKVLVQNASPVEYGQPLFIIA